MEKKISVIVPVYNVAAYLPECMDSILCQDYEALEIILIDDGSTDESGRICDDYAEKDSRIRVIHQKNGGAAAAKNAGLRIASGEYLSFVDSDDFLEPGAYCHMLTLLEEYKADVVQCAFRKVFQNYTEDQIDLPGRKVESTDAALLHFLSGWSSPILWNKLYRKKLFDGVFFEEGHVIDDEFFTYQGIMNAKTIVYDDRIIYNYRMRRSSVMHLPHLERRRLSDKLDYLDKRRKRIGQNYPQLKKAFDAEYLYDLVCLSRKAYNTEESILAIKAQVKRYFSDGNYVLPGVRCWPSLLKLYFCNANTILRKLEKPDEKISVDSLYA